MRRSVIIVMLLAASHGAALWLGAQRQKTVATGQGQVLAAKTERSSTGAAERRGMGESNEEPEEENDNSEQIKAARARITADTDVAAIVRAGGTGIAAKFDPEMIAALGVWLDRDPVAALQRCLDWTRVIECEEVGEEFQKYLARGNLGKLQLLFDGVPRARGGLLEIAVAVLSAEGRNGEAIGIAGGLRSMADRRDLLGSVFGDAEDVSGHLAQIRGLLDRSNAAAFLGQFREGNRQLLEEAIAADFPAGALKHFEAVCQESEKNKGKRIGNDWISAQSSPPGSTPVLINTEELSKAVPDFREWSDRVREGRVAPQDFYARLTTAFAGRPEMDNLLSGLATAAGFESDPAGTMKWLKEVNGDWQNQYEQSFWLSAERISPEVLARDVVAIAGTEAPPEGIMSQVRAQYSRWLVSDREACLQAIAKLPSGPVRSDLEKMTTAPPQEEEEE